MSNPTIIVVEKDDVLRAVERAYAGRPAIDDANLLRAVAAWVDGLYQYGDAVAACSDANPKQS